MISETLLETPALLPVLRAVCLVLLIIFCTHQRHQVPHVFHHVQRDGMLKLVVALDNSEIVPVMAALQVDTPAVYHVLLLMLNSHQWSPALSVFHHVQQAGILNPM